MNTSQIPLTNIHPGMRVVKNGEVAAKPVCLADVASEHFDRAAALGSPITRRAAWRFALRDFGNGVYRLAPKRKRHTA